MASFQYVIPPKPLAPGEEPGVFDPTGGYLGTLSALNTGRIPMGGELEAASSNAIAGLLNPPLFFPEVDRMSAEAGAARGVPGSPASFGTGVRMTDEERLRRMTLGQQFLSSAYGRQPAFGSGDIAPFVITPFQQQQLELERQRFELARRQQEFEHSRLNQPTVSYGGSGGGAGGLQPPDLRAAAYTTYPGTSPSFTGSTGATGFPRGEPYINPSPGTWDPNPGSPLLPLYPGGPVPGTSTVPQIPSVPTDADYWNMGIGVDQPYDGGLPGFGTDEDLMDFLIYG